MSIGFSVSQTSGEKATRSAAATKVTAKTASAAQNRRVRSGSGSGTRSTSRRQRRRASQPRGSPRAAARRPSQPRTKASSPSAHTNATHSAALSVPYGISVVAPPIHTSQVTKARPSTLARPRPAPGRRASTTPASGAAPSPISSMSAQKRSASVTRGIFAGRRDGIGRFRRTCPPMTRSPTSR